jgi:hypothetical protein
MDLLALLKQVSYRNFFCILNEYLISIHTALMSIGEIDFNDLMYSEDKEVHFKN